MPESTCPAISARERIKGPDDGGFTGCPKRSGATIQAVVIAAAVCALVAGSSPASAAGDAGRTGGIRTLRSLSFDSPGRKKRRPIARRRVLPQERIQPGYGYSAALKAANITWDEHTLDQFLANPAADVHGTKMFISIPMATLEPHCLLENVEVTAGGRT